MERSSRLMLGVTVAVLILVLLADLSSAQLTNVPPVQQVDDPTGISSSANPTRWKAYFAELQPAILDILPYCYCLHECNELKLVKNISSIPISEYKGQPGPRTNLFWNDTAFPNITKAMAGDYVCENEYGMAQQSYQLNVVAHLSIQCPSTVDVLFNTTGTVIVNSTGSLLSKVISNSSLANLTSNSSTSTDGSVKLSTTWNTSCDLVFNSTNNIEWTAMYTFKECSTSIFYPSMKQNCEKARKPVTCTTKINIYKNCQNFSRQDISPSSPPSLNFRTNFSVNCGGNYTRNKSAGANVTHVTCQRDGKWSDLPSCIFCNCSQGDKCASTASGAKCIPPCTSSPAPCHQNASCSDTTEKIICTCKTGYTGNGTGTDGCKLIPTTMTTTMTSNTTNNMTTAMTTTMTNNTTNNMTTSSEQGGPITVTLIIIISISCSVVALLVLVLVPVALVIVWRKSHLPASKHENDREISGAASEDHVLRNDTASARTDSPLSSSSDGSSQLPPTGASRFRSRLNPYVLPPELSHAAADEASRTSSTSHTPRVPGIDPDRSPLPHDGWNNSQAAHSERRFRSKPNDYSSSPTPRAPPRGTANHDSTFGHHPAVQNY